MLIKQRHAAKTCCFVNCGNVQLRLLTYDCVKELLCLCLLMFHPAIMPSIIYFRGLLGGFNTPDIFVVLERIECALIELIEDDVALVGS